MGGTSGPLVVVHRAKSELLFAACVKLGNEDMQWLPLVYLYVK